MDNLTQKILDKFNQLSPELQQEALNYIDFLIHRHGLDSSKKIPTMDSDNEETNTIEVHTEIIEEPNSENTVETSPIEEVVAVEAETPSIEAEEENIEDSNSENVVEKTPIEEVVVVEAETPSIEVEEENIEKEEPPTAEDLQLDEQIENIEEKKKDKLAPDWQEVKQAFKDEFF